MYRTVLYVMYCVNKTKDQTCHDDDALVDSPSFLPIPPSRIMKVDHLFAHLMMAILLLLCNSLAFVYDVSCPRRISVDAIASPLEQIKRDFVGSLENAYDFNDANPVSSLFLSRLVEQVGTRRLDFRNLNICLMC